MGVISKVSGPVIQAEGMRGNTINELVKVGEMELLGEIIALKGDRASIQVYEETSGLRPGEPVKGTGAPLSVELGPGLLSGVFDGIQRPLEKIRAKAGDFISRGIQVNALDRKKKWEFKPTAKKGETVNEGDVLGEVKEYNIVHRILVPIGVKGKISSIESGNFTIDEEVAVVGGTPVKMLQIWPVRKPRPYKEKKLLEPPLITGMRIIDTLFPVAKGGTAAIPGPFGAGKCVDGGTPVLLGDGRLLPIKQIFEQVKGKGNLIEANELEEIYSVNGDFSIVSFDGKTFSLRKPSCVYKGKTSKMIKVKTRSGKTVEVTPIHKLFVLEDDKIVEKPAQELQLGHCLVTPRKLDFFKSDAAIDVLSLLGDSNLISADENANLTFREALDRLLEQGILERKYANYLKKERMPPLRLMRRIGVLSGLTFSVNKVKPKHGKTIAVPSKMSPDLAEFLGFVIADGNLHKQTYSIRFYNSAPELLARFSQLCAALFGLAPVISPHPMSPGSFIAQVDSKAIFCMVNALGVPFVQKARNATVPQSVLASRNECASAFVSAYIACDGSVDVAGSRVEICSASTRVLEEISFLLLRFGIISRLEKPRKDGTRRLWISSKSNLEQLACNTKIFGRKGELLSKAIKSREWSSVDAFLVPASFKKLLADPQVPSALRNQGFIQRYGAEHSVIGAKTLQKLIHRLSDYAQPALKEFSTLCSQVFFDEITGVESVDGDRDVYDLEVPETHNFVGGHGAMLLHNTVTNTTIAKQCDADIIVYVGAGERGNEMSEVLTEFPKLIDPRSGRPLMERTVLIANTSNMPVAARESSIYTGITIAEYYRDLGYDVALMADSTSRWAEAMREISGRMEEMPGEEGYPAYLGKRLAEFYERAGRVHCLGEGKGKNARSGSVTAIGAVSPPGGDLSEPVSQNTLRVTKVFWALDANLSRRRHYPAINWLRSYSLYLNELRPWYAANVAEDFVDLRAQAMSLLQQEAELQNIVQLIGPDALPDKERLVLETSKMLREDLLQQNSFVATDSFTSLKKQYWMLKTILHFYSKSVSALALDMQYAKIVEAKEKDVIAQLKHVAEKEVEQKCKDVMHSIDRTFSKQ